MVGASGVFKRTVGLTSTPVSPTDLCAGFVGKDVVFRFIIEYSGLRDFGS